MFSNVHRRPVLSWLRVFGVTADNREVALLAYNDLWPLDQSRLPLGLRHIASQPDGAAKLQIALSDVLTRYNSRRAEGDIEGPELRAVRLYRLEWPLERFAANLEHPRTRELLAEVPAPARTER